MRVVVLLLALFWSMAVARGLRGKASRMRLQRRSSFPRHRLSPWRQPLKKSITEWDEFTGRLPGRRDSRCPRSRQRISWTKFILRTARSSNKGDSPFHDRQAAISNRGRTGKGTGRPGDRRSFDLANSDVERARPLLERRTITGREFESREATARGALASLSAARAELRNAELNLQWTEVISPISRPHLRYTSRRRQSRCRRRERCATVLTRIVSLDPIHFEFEGSEADYLKYTTPRPLWTTSVVARQRQPGCRPPDRRGTSSGTGGKMDFVDNALDPKSGTIKGRAIFEE